VQETFDDGQFRKQALPRFLGGDPAICIDGLRSIVRADLLRFVLKGGLGSAEGRFIRLQRERGTQNTIAPHRGGNVSFVPIEAGVLLIG